MDCAPPLPAVRGAPRPFLRGRCWDRGLSGGWFVLRRLGFGAILLNFFLCLRLTLDWLGFCGFGRALVFALFFARLGCFRKRSERGDLLGGARRSGIDDDRRDRPRLAQQVLWRRAKRGEE